MGVSFPWRVSLRAFSKIQCLFAKVFIINALLKLVYVWKEISQAKRFKL